MFANKMKHLWRLYWQWSWYDVKCYKFLISQYSWEIQCIESIHFLKIRSSDKNLNQKPFESESVLSLQPHGPPGSSVHGILQAIPFPRGSSRPRDWTQVSCIAGRFFIIWATREAHSHQAVLGTQVATGPFFRIWSTWKIILSSNYSFFKPW